MKKNFLLIFLLVLIFSKAQAMCDVTFLPKDISKVTDKSEMVDMSSYGSGVIPSSYFRAYQKAVDKLTKVAGVYPQYVICSDLTPNAFAGPINGQNFIGVTVGLIQLTKDDEDMAAAVISHELAHFTLNHSERQNTANDIFGVLGLVIGTAADVAIYATYQVETSIGRNLAYIGANLATAMFSRDSEHEADEKGFEYSIAGGYSPYGGIRLAKVFLNSGYGSSGLFYDSHPGWDDREERYTSLIEDSNIKYAEYSKPQPKQSYVASNEINYQQTSTFIELPEEKPSSMSQYNWQRYKSALKNFNDGLKNNDEGNRFKFATRPPDIENYNFGAENEANIAYNQINNLEEKILKTEENYVEPIYVASAIEINYENTVIAWANKNFEEVKRLAVERVKTFKDGAGYTTIGSLYKLGLLGTEKDLTKAKEYYELAMELKSPSGFNNYAVLCITEEDYTCSFNAYKKAATLKPKLGEVFYGLGWHYLNGLGTNKDLLLAEKNFIFASSLKQPPQGHLSLLIYFTKENPIKELEEFHSEKVYELGTAEDIFSVGMYYIEGDYGFTKDPRKGIKYIEKAAKNNHTGALFNLYIWNTWGINMSKNKEKGKVFLVKAARLGDQTAIDEAKKYDISS